MALKLLVKLKLTGKLETKKHKHKLKLQIPIRFENYTTWFPLIRNSVGVLVIIIETINKITVNTRDSNYRLNQKYFQNLKTTTELKV